MCIGLWGYVHMCAGTSIRSPGIGITSGCEMSEMDAGNWPRVPWMSSKHSQPLSCLSGPSKSFFMSYNLDITTLSAFSLQMRISHPTTPMKSLRLQMKLPYFLNNAQSTVNHDGQGPEFIKIFFEEGPLSCRGQVEAELGSVNRCMDSTVS